MVHPKMLILSSFTQLNFHKTSIHKNSVYFRNKVFSTNGRQTKHSESFLHPPTPIKDHNKKIHSLLTLSVFFKYVFTSNSCCAITLFKSPWEIKCKKKYFPEPRLLMKMDGRYSSSQRSHTSALIPQTIYVDVSLLNALNFMLVFPFGASTV